MKGLAQVMDHMWVFSGNIIPNFSAVKHSLDHADSMGRGDVPDCRGVRTTEVKLRGIDNIKKNSKFQRKIP
jgi:hypothetical protein